MRVEYSIRKASVLWAYLHGLVVAYDMHVPSTFDI